MAEEPQVQEAPVQQEPAYVDKVYSALKDKVSGFNKTPEQFKESMKDTTYTNKVYSALKDKVSGFNKSQDDFYSAVGLKKKDESSASKSQPNTSQYPAISENKGKYLKPGQAINIATNDGVGHGDAKNTTGLRKPKLEKSINVSPKISEQQMADEQKPEGHIGLTPIASAIDEGLAKITDIGSSIFKLDRMTSTKPEEKEMGEKMFDWASDYLRSFAKKDPLPENIPGQLIKGVAESVPAAAAAYASGGESTLADASTYLTKSQILQQALTKAADPITKYMVATGFGEGAKKGTDLQSTLMGGMQMAQEGMYNALLLHGSMGAGENIGGGLFKLGKKLGVVTEDGAITRQALKSVVGTPVAFGMSSVAQDLAIGKPVDWKNAGITAVSAFPYEVPHIMGAVGEAKGIEENKKATDESINKAIEAGPANRIMNFLTASEDDIAKAMDKPESAAELQVKSLGEGVKAQDAKTSQEKNTYHLSQLELQQHSDIKGMVDMIKNDKPGLINSIQESQLPDGAKQGLIEKVNAVAKQYDPIEKLGSQIEDLNKQIEQAQAEKPEDVVGQRKQALAIEELEANRDKLTEDLDKLIKTKNDGEKTNVAPDQEKEGRPGQQVAERPKVSQESEKEGGQRLNEKPASRDGEKVVSDGAENAPLQKGEENAIQEPSTESVPVQSAPGHSEAVGEGNAKEEKTAEKSQEKPEEKKPIGISKERTNRQREERGLEEIPESEHTTLRAMFNEGKQAIDEGAVDPRKVAAEVANEKRNLTSTEVNSLLHDRRTLHDEMEDLRDQLAKIDMDKDPLTYQAYNDRLSHLEHLLDNNEQALVKGGRENSLALNSMRSMINADYSHTMQAARMRAKSGGELTADMKAELDRYSEELKRTKKELEDYKKGEAERIAKIEAAKIARQTTKQADLSKIKDLKKQNIDKFRERLKQIRKSGTLTSDIPYRRELAAAAPFIKNHVQLLIQEGVIKFEDIIDKIHDEFSKDITDLTKRDVMDVLAGNYNERKESKNELLEQKNAIIKLARLTAKLDDLKNKVNPADRLEGSKGKEVLSEKNLVQTRKQILDIEQEIKDINRKARIEMLEPRTQESLQKRLDKINKRIAEGDFEPPVPRAKITSPSAKTIALQAKVRKAENNFDAMAERLGKHTQTKLQKNLDLYRKINLAFILSGTKVMGKLWGFGAAKRVTNQMDELFNHLNSITPGIRKIVERSPRYSGGYSPKAEAKAIAARWNLETLKDVWETAQTGAGSLDRMYGKRGVDRDFEQNHPFLDFFQHLHGALKTPTKRAEFFRSLEHRLDFYAKQGEDIHDPDVQFKAGLEAYADGKRAILMDDNILTDKFYKAGLRALENSPDPAPEALGAFIRTVFPITKVPTNFALNVFDRVSLGARAYPKIWKAMIKGAESLTNEEADSVARILSKGQTGLAMMALAYFSPGLVKFGGYYTGKRKEGDLDPGDVIIGDFKVPHNLAHNDVIEAMQFATTVRRAQDYAKEKGEDTGTLVGLAQGTKGIAKQIPFIDSKYLTDLSSDKKATQAAGTFIKNKIEPRLLQEVAEYGDKDTKTKFLQHPIDYMMSDTKKRDPQSILENLKMGIPGVRQQVGTKEEHTLDTKLSTITNDKGEKQKLTPREVTERKKLYDDYLKTHEDKLRKEYNEIWNKTEAKKQEKNIPFWKRIGRSDAGIKKLIEQAKEKEFEKFKDDMALGYSEAKMVKAVKKDKNKFTIK